MATTKVQSELIVDDVALAGNPTTSTQSAGNNTTRIATTAFVTTAVDNLIASAPGTMDTLNEIAAALGDDPSFTTTVNNAIALKAPLASPTFTGAVTAPTTDISAGTVNGTSFADNRLLRLQNTSTTDGSRMGIAFQGNSSIGSGLAWIEGVNYDQSIGATDIRFSTYSGSAWNADMMTLSNNGHVGINQTSPQAKLDIKGDTTTYAGMSKIYLTDTSSNSERRNWAIGNGGSGYGHFTIGLSNAADGDPMVSGSHTTPFVIDHTGNAAIGRGGNVGKGLLTISEAGNTAGAAIDGVQLYKGLTNASNFLAWQQGNMGWRLGIRHNDGGYPLTLYMNNGSTPTAASPGDEILRFGTDQNMALNNTTTGWSAWSANSSCHLTVGNGGNSPTTSNYGVLNLLGSQGGSTHFSIGVGNGTMYAAYDYGNGAHRLTINSSGNFTGSASNDISDQRLKENIVTIPNALDKVKALKGRTFTWKASSKQATGTKYGFIAQEVESVASDLVYKDSGLCKIDSDDNPIHDIINYEGDAEYAKSVQTSGIIPILVEAMKEQQTIIDDLKSRLEALEG